METRPLNIMRDKFRGLLMAAFPAIIFLVSHVPAATPQFSEAGVQKFEAPVDAADFTLKEIGGKEISLRELRGKVAVINFFTVW